MMREIKYRIYVAGRFDYWGFIDGGFAALPSNNREPLSIKEMQARSEQYTGFKDRNDKEIFAGDKLRITDGADEIDLLDSNTGIGTVVWLEDYLLWYVTDINNGLGDLNDMYYFEIISNIHETPELLK